MLKQSSRDGAVSRRWNVGLGKVIGSDNQREQLDLAGPSQRRDSIMTTKRLAMHVMAFTLGFTVSPGMGGSANVTMKPLMAISLRRGQNIFSVFS